jgi:effector-binding domain-containing protein
LWKQAIKNKIMRIISLLGCTLLIVSCSSNSTKELTREVKDSLNKKQAAPVTEGMQGVQNIPSLLTLSIRDTATIENISSRVGIAYSSIQDDIKNLKLEMAGSPGVLYYTNDPKKILFECVIPISKAPTLKPKYSDVITLEPIKALVYNYYGPYNKLFTAYEKLKTYLQENKLEQIGAAREFYITDPELEKDSAKWLSKIYIPVN